MAAETLSNSVKSLKAAPFERRTFQQKLDVKESGPDQPNIKIKQKSKDRGREYTKSFFKSWFSNRAWLAACSETNALFCFPCLLFPTSACDSAWTRIARFQEYHSQFPEAALNTTIEAYPLLNKSRLKTELALVYSNDEFRNCSGVVTLYQLFMENNLQDIFSDTVALLKSLITTPRTTAESERCCSTLERIKTFLRNTMSQDHLNALAMLFIERNLVKNIPDFNHSVIDKFASRTEGQNLCTKNRTLHDTIR
ncbi:uncharacterized protein LOC133416454 [Phycodurus eques]|uniref:uncharacterized protein LOC133416454 n=1 Tax=Phycodurus eques TaxID=693459 RepID=UPI002ACEA36E|nr:uncharacterized protein LOC133416454 [Phycodurus eques]